MDDSSHQTDIDYDELAAKLSTFREVELYDPLVNLPFHNKIDVVTLLLGFICLYIVDESGQTIQLVAASGTEQYELSVEGSDSKLIEYRLDLDADAENTIVKVVRDGTPRPTADWATLGRRKTPPEVARINQANSGIGYSAVYPLKSSIVTGAMMYSYYQSPDQMGTAQQDFMTRYTELASQLLDRPPATD